MSDYEKIKLKPCPVCGSDKTIVLPEIIIKGNPYGNLSSYGGVCLECYKAGQICETRELAACAWNLGTEKTT